MSIPIVIDLTPEDWALVNYHAKRLEPHVKGNYREGYRDWTGCNFSISLPAEIAYGKWIGESPNFELLDGSDGGYDFTRHYLANVKGTPWWRRPHLLTPAADRHKVRTDVRYVLGGVDAEGSKVLLHGWAHGHEIIAQRAQDWKQGANWVSTLVILPGDLHPMIEMKPGQRSLFA